MLDTRYSIFFIPRVGERIEHPVSSIEHLAGGGASHS
jgi:hypothetical protein